MGVAGGHVAATQAAVLGVCSVAWERSGRALLIMHSTSLVPAAELSLEEQYRLSLSQYRVRIVSGVSANHRCG